MLGKPWLYKPDTKMKTDWEDVEIPSHYVISVERDPETNGFIVHADLSKYIKNQLAKQEAEYKRKIEELGTDQHKIDEMINTAWNNGYEKAENKLKQQHRAELEGKFMISAFDAHYLAGVILSELGHPIFEKSHAVARNMQKNREALCEMFLALIEQHKMQFSQKEIDFVTNLLEQKGK